LKSKFSVARSGEMSIAYKVLNSEIFKADLGVYERIIFKIELRKYSMTVWMQLAPNAPTSMRTKLAADAHLAEGQFLQ
jgi:hypothetical protein